MANYTSNPVERHRNDYVSLTADTTLIAADSGKTFLLDAVGEAILLPAPSLGLHYKFLITVDVITSAWTVAATSNLVFGSVTEAGLVQLSSAETTLSVIHTKSIRGDWFTLECDGTNWHLAGQFSVAQSFTTA